MLTGNLAIMNSFKKKCDSLKTVEGRRIGTSKSNLRLLEGIHNEQLLLKQAIKSHPKAQIKLIYDVIASHMAQALGLPCAEIELIPLSDICCHKFFSDQIALLMTRVPGIIIRKGSKYFKLDLRQKIKKGDVEKTGVTLEVMRNMSLHKDLALMLALDTYLGNSDRSPGNASYDEANDRFYAIDFGESFDLPLCRGVRVTLKKIKDGTYKLTSDEWESLALYKRALQNIVQLYPPEKIGQELDYLIDYSGLIDQTLVNRKFSGDIKDTVEKIKKFMDVQYSETRELIHFIDTILGSQH